MSLDRAFYIHPAYDKRKEGFGIHGVEMCWYVKGPEGAVQFILYTNWQLKHIQEEFDARIETRHPHLFCHPQPADIGYHSRVPHYEGHEPMKEDCEVIGGKCYYDGSSLQANDFYNILVQEGGEALWKALEVRYDEWLRPNRTLVEEAAMGSL